MSTEKSLLYIKAKQNKKLTSNITYKQFKEVEVDNKAAFTIDGTQYQKYTKRQLN